MKIRKIAAPAALLLCGLSPSFAVEVTGGFVGLGYSSFTGDLDDLDRTAVDGAIQLGFSREFSLQAGIGFADYGFSDADSTSVDLHAIYHLNEFSSLGVFVGRTELEGEGVNFIGLEGGMQQGPLGGEIYLSRAERDDVSGTSFGLMGTYELSQMGRLTASYDHLDDDGMDLSRIALGGEFRPSPGFSLTGEIGSAKIDDLGSEAFVAAGFRFNFGAQKGTTFARRNPLNIIPGF